MKPVNNSASPPSKRPAPLHGGPVSPWPRRVRQLIRASAALAVTCALIAVVSVIALTGATALGAMPISLALLIIAVVMYTTAGLRPLTVALAVAAVLTIYTAGSDTAWLEVELVLNALVRALRAITG